MTNSVSVSPPSGPARTLTRVITGLLLAASAAYTLAFIYVALRRLGYPFDLEWMEGGMVDWVNRLLSGEPAYGPPSLEFTPFIYTPLYLYLSAGVARITGPGYLPLRLVAFLSALGCIAVLVLIVRRETGSSVAGICSGGLFAAAYPLGGCWYDIARCDTLFISLLLAGVYLLRFTGPGAGHVAAGVLFALAFQAKQAALFVALPIAVYMVYRLRLRSLYFLVAAAVGILLPSLILNHIAGGWFRFYVFTLPGEHSLALQYFTAFWSSDLGRMLPALVLVVLLLRLASRPVCPAADVRPTAEDVGPSDSIPFYFAVLCGMLFGAWGSRLHHGGYLNVIIPALAGLSLLSGVALRALPLRVSTASGWQRTGAELAVGTILLLQFGLLYYRPDREIPGPKDVAAAAEVVSRIRDVPGRVYCPNHPHVVAQAGKQPCAHFQAVSDVKRGRNRPIRSALLAQLDSAMNNRLFEGVVLSQVLDTGRSAGALGDVNKHYRLACYPLFSDTAVLYMRTGAKSRPLALYLLRPDSIQSPAKGTDTR